MKLRARLKLYVGLIMYSTNLLSTPFYDLCTGFVRFFWSVGPRQQMVCLYQHLQRKLQLCPSLRRVRVDALVEL